MSLSGVFGEIIGAVTGLYVVNSIPFWHIPVIVTDPYQLFLPYANAAIIGVCIVRMLMYLSPWYRLRLVFEGMSELIGLFSLYMLLTIFPFNFTPINRVEINSLLQFALMIALFGLGIAFLITILRLIRGKP
jgi:hypothetical protein